MRHNTEMTGSIARERLKFMIESGQMENSPQPYGADEKRNI